MHSRTKFMPARHGRRRRCGHANRQPRARGRVRNLRQLPVTGLPRRPPVGPAKPSPTSAPGRSISAAPARRFLLSLPRSCRADSGCRSNSSNGWPNPGADSGLFDRRLIGIGGHLTMPPLPHHRAYGSVPRRFDRIRPQQGCRVWGGRASRNGGCVGPAGPPHVRPCASTPSASQRRWRLGPLRVPGGGAP